ncbi:LamG-like jellyroll fold domain-containing protein [Kitasatospora sp. NPDC094015]|uniref:LamG-like jellyroll fold domain-containing protein n=1 Tax=Kitasatospora sp. NPDC094015 TaxID=3155205 RepID=UPI00332B41AD
MLARYTDTDNYYLFVHEEGALKIKKKAGGTVTTVASKPFTLTTGTWYTLRGTVKGDALELSVDGVEQLTGTGGGLPHGRVGLISFHGDVRESAYWTAAEGSVGGALPLNRWIGFKFVARNIDAGNDGDWRNDTQVRLELYKEMSIGNTVNPARRPAAAPGSSSPRTPTTATSARASPACTAPRRTTTRTAPRPSPSPRRTTPSTCAPTA